MDKNIYKVGNITSTIDTVVTNINFILDTQKSTTVKKGTYYTKNINLLESILKLLDYEYIHDFIYSNNTFYEKLKKLSDFITVKKDYLDMNDVNTYETLYEYKQFFEINLKSFIITNTIGQYFPLSNLETFAKNLVNLQQREEKINDLIIKTDSLINNFKANSEQVIKNTENETQSFIKRLSNIIDSTEDQKTSFINRLSDIIAFQEKRFSKLNETNEKINNILEFLNTIDTESIKTNVKDKTDELDTTLNNINDQLKAIQEKVHNLDNEVVKEELAHYFSSEAKKLENKQKDFMYATFAGIGAILILSFIMSCTVLFSDILDIKDIPLFIPLYMGLTWFTWFSAKQYSYYKQIIDEYNYKTALSKSYIIYRDEIKDPKNNKSENKEAENNEILLLLLSSVINNIATSPVQSVKSDFHTPFSEILNAAKEAGKLNSQNKKSE